MKYKKIFKHFTEKRCYRRFLIEFIISLFIIMIIHFAHKLNEKVNRKVIIGNILQMDTGTPT